jgi:hypothetical protein
VDIPISSTFGNGTTAVSYPGDFPTGANTNFTGQYQISFNATLAAETFFIGLTNSSEYHRFQTVDVKAAGYVPGENVTVTIAGNNVYNSENVTADGSTGIVHFTNWAVPSNASIGSYMASIVSISNTTNKTPKDIQNFTVPGYAVNTTTLNLAGEVVSNVVLRVFENGLSLVNGSDNAGSPGLIRTTLEIGDYTREAYFKDTRVGEDSLRVMGETSLNFNCSLTNLRITVADEAENRLPEVHLFLTPDNLTLNTDINGTVVVHSLLPNVTYALNASRYNTLFNTTAIPLLPAIAWLDLPITCPTLALQVNVTQWNGQPITNALVKAMELMGGLLYQGDTVDGLVTLNCTLGKYAVEVYVNDVKLSDTTVDLNESKIIGINCGLYGLDISVRVVDYFGQGISNVNVTLQRSGSKDSAVAGGDGLVAFNSVIGGDLQVIIRLSGQSEPCVVKTVNILGPQTIEVKIEKYVALGGMLVETSRLLTVIVIVLIVVLILSIELLRRRHLPKQKSES